VDEQQMRDCMELLGPLYSLKYDKNLAKERRERQIVSPDAINQAFGGFLRTYNITAELSKITMPTLVIGARHDWICAPEFSEIIASKIYNADLRMFENSGHWVTIDEHQAFIDVVRGFLTYKI
jgi:proline iminopeptidase